jgi:hypothetical protein
VEKSAEYREVQKQKKSVTDSTPVNEAAWSSPEACDCPGVKRDAGPWKTEKNLPGATRDAEARIATMATAAILALCKCETAGYAHPVERSQILT